MPAFGTKFEWLLRSHVLRVDAVERLKTSEARTKNRKRRDVNGPTAMEKRTSVPFGSKYFAYECFETSS